MTRDSENPPAHRQPHAETAGARLVGAVLGRGWSSPWVPWVVVAGAVAALLLTASDSPSDHSCCPFRWLTGYPCPTCGLTHAVLSALHGRWSESWRYHPFGVLVLLGAVLLAVDQGWWLVRGEALLSPSRLARLRPLAWIGGAGLGVAWVAFTISRW